MLRTAIALTFAGLLASAGSATAQNYPTKPITMIVPFAAGGPADVFGRLIAPRMSETLGQQVIVESIGGAGGMTGAKRVANAPPDGYTFLIGTVGSQAQSQTMYKTPLYNAATDFTPVGLLADVPLILIVRKDLPVNNLQEFIAYAKANQAKMQFGSGGAGSATHLACVLLDLAIGVNVTHVPYRSAVMAIEDMVGGRIDYVCPITSTAVAQIQGKRVKAIAMLSKERPPILPDLPTASEQALEGFDAYIWNGVFVPKDTPDAVVTRLHDAIVAAMDTPSVDQRIRQMGGALVAPERRSPAYLRQFVEDEIRKWAAPIKASGLSMD
jgi:tripartite-type tricarboxylate transporter receptor subunit TctC